jgi:hypothetical protein
LRPGESAEHGAQLVGIDRFDQVCGEPGALRGLPIARLSVVGDGNQPCCTQAGVRGEPLRQLESVHDR